MADMDEDRPESPPLPKGSYNFNFDDFDENSDPFKPKKGLGNSPDKDLSNPFQSQSKLSSSPPIHQNHVPEENPFQTKAKLSSSPPMHENDMTEESPFQTKTKLSSSPPVHENDMEEESPFETKTKLSSSPPMHENDVTEESPFQTKTKLSSSPSGDHTDLTDNNPFQSNCKLGSSPPGGSIPGPNFDSGYDGGDTNVDTGLPEETIDTSNNAIESPAVKSNKGLKKRAKSKTPPAGVDDAAAVDNDSNNMTHGGGAGEPNEAEPVEVPKQAEKKKPASPKKSSGIKKPKARSKFKPPAHFGVQNAGEDVIFAPPPPKPSEVPIEPDPVAPEEPLSGDIGEGVDDGAGEPISSDGATNLPNQLAGFGGELISSDGATDLPNHMAGFDDGGRVSEMMESVHDFGAGEMPIDNNEGFVAPDDAFPADDEGWMESNEDNIPAGRESLSAFDPLTEDQLPDKVTRRVSDVGILENSSVDDDDLMLMNTPPAQSRGAGAPSRGTARHPAARALQEQVEGDGAPRDAQVMDKMLFSPVRGEELKPAGDPSEHYYDALEYPYGRARQGEREEADRINSSNRKNGSAGESSQNIVQLVQDPDEGHSQVLKYSQSDWNKMRQELELDYNARMLNKEREWSKKLADRDKRICTLDDQVLLLRSANDDMKLVVAEFEKTISQLQAEKMKTTTESQQSFEDVVKERDQALEDLQSVETAFSDLHQRYERTKGVVEGFKKNEDTLKKCVQDYQVKLKTAEDKAVSVRREAEEKLGQASQEMDKVRKTTSSELARLEAALKKAELKVQGVEKNLEQKIRENDELTAICDELIAKVGGD